MLTFSVRAAVRPALRMLSQKATAPQIKETKITPGSEEDITAKFGQKPKFTYAYSQNNFSEQSAKVAEWTRKVEQYMKALEKETK